MMAMPVSATGSMMSMTPAPASVMPAEVPGRAVFLDADAWLASQPEPWRKPDAMWHALAPIRPLDNPRRPDTDAELRAILFDPVYQLM